MNISFLAPLLLLFFSCGKNREISSAPATNTTGKDELLTTEELVESFSYPSPNILFFENETLADFSQNLAVVSSFGTVSKGVTLNLVTIKGTDFLIYGEDGVFAAECEPSASFPTHGPSHPLCQTAHGESFDKIILCASSVKSTSLLIAQNWPGVEVAFSNDTLGMKCWVNGVKMLSEKIFTY
ncbi:MAG: hypothetical protein QE271_01990 [Bacteriovoracaceae bacterium]|nr:hypothetical protein [Bacteriovoracaceae bacterium]